MPRIYARQWKQINVPCFENHYVVILRILCVRFCPCTDFVRKTSTVKSDLRDRCFVPITSRNVFNFKTIIIATTIRNGVVLDVQTSYIQNTDCSFAVKTRVHACTYVFVNGSVWRKLVLRKPRKPADRTDRVIRPVFGAASGDGQKCLSTAIGRK